MTIATNNSINDDMGQKMIVGKTYSEIAQSLREQIELGTFAYGSSLPTIRSTASELGVSPQTVAKAISVLSNEGYLASKQGSGTRVIYLRPREVNQSIAMLVDEKTSNFLKFLDEPADYHSKDIYLSYMLHMTREGKKSHFIKYNLNKMELSDDEKKKILTCSGLIIQGSLPKVYKDFIGKENIPTVLINRSIGEQSYGRWGQVMIDYTRLKDMFHYIASLGHEKIIFAVPDYLIDSAILKRRFSEFEATAKSVYAGREFEFRKCRVCAEDAESIEEIKRLIKDGFTASVGFNDIAALIMYQILHELKIRIPNDFSVVGFDDLFIATMAVPPLTTLRVCREDLVGKALSLLDRLITDSESSNVLFDEVGVELVIRKSTFIAPTVSTGNHIHYD